MFPNWLSRCGIVACLALSFAARAYAQDACPAPPALTTTAKGNMFSDEQENWLGDVMADWIEHR